MYCRGGVHPVCTPRVRRTLHTLPVRDAPCVHSQKRAHPHALIRKAAPCVHSSSGAHPSYIPGGAHPVCTPGEGRTLHALQGKGTPFMHSSAGVHSVCIPGEGCTLHALLRRGAPLTHSSVGDAHLGGVGCGGRERLHRRHVRVAPRLRLLGRRAEVDAAHHLGPHQGTCGGKQFVW